MAKKDKKTKNTKKHTGTTTMTATNVETGTGVFDMVCDGDTTNLNINCDPMSRYDETWGCHDDDCASDVWQDGCEACLCFNSGNTSRFDGTNNAYYDNYYNDNDNDNDKNHFGDTNYKNRKCETELLPKDAPCRWTWQCERRQ